MSLTQSATTQPAAGEPHPLKYPLRYETRDALANLPWFEIDHGALVLADSSIGPIIDVHTHYALPSVGTGAIDLHKETSDSNLLLGRCCAHHLDIYANQCFTPKELAAMKRELVLGGIRGRGKRPDHTAPNLARDMLGMGVTHSIVLGIDMPVPTRHVQRTLEVAHTRSDVTGYGSLYPRRKNLRQRFEDQLHAGAKGIKVHPNNMFIRPDDPLAMPIYQWAGQAGVPIFWHCGPAGIEPKRGAECGQVRHYDAPIREHPNTTFVLGHSGALQHREAIELCRKYPNVYMDLSCISIWQMKEVLEQCDENRLMFGSDWPFYHPILPLAKVLILTEDRPALRRKILYENAARLLELNP